MLLQTFNGQVTYQPLAQPRFRNLTECCPEIIIASVRQLYDRKQVAPDLGTLAHVAAASTAAASIFDVKRPDADDAGGGICPTAVYLGINAKSGSGKSAAERHAFAAIKEFDRQQREAYPQRVIEYKGRHAGWIVVRKALRKRLDEIFNKTGIVDGGLEQDLALHEFMEPKPPKLRQFIRNKTTRAGMLSALKGARESIALSNDEGGLLLNRDFKDLVSDLTAFWDGSSQTDTSGNDTIGFTKDPRVTLTFMIQDGLLQTYFQKYGSFLRHQGFLARVLIFVPLSNIGRRYFQAAKHEIEGGELFQERIREILNLTHCMGEGERIVLEFDAYATRRWYDYANEFERLMAPGMYLHEATDVGSKAMDQITRLAALFHIISRKNGQISVESLERAYSFYWFCLNEFMRIFATPRDVLNANALIPVLHKFFVKNFLSVRCSWFETYGPVATRPASELKSALNRLELQGVITLETSDRKRWVKLNPAFFQSLPTWAA